MENHIDIFLKQLLYTFFVSDSKRWHLKSHGFNLMSLCECDDHYYQ